MTRMGARVRPRGSVAAAWLWWAVRLPRHGAGAATPAAAISKEEIRDDVEDRRVGGGRVLGLALVGHLHRQLQLPCRGRDLRRHGP